MLCDPKKLTNWSLDVAVQVLREAAAQPFLSLEAMDVIYDGDLGDILDEGGLREEVGF